MKITKFIKDKTIRFNYLSLIGFYNYMSDENFLKKIYKLRTKGDLNLDNPKTFNEKIQWLKINDKNPTYTKMVDKYGVREYIKKTIGDEYLIPLIGVWDSFEEIDIDALPRQFVMKTTHDSGGVIICKDKNNFDFKKCKAKIKKNLKLKYYNLNREWPYKDVKPRIIVEKYMAGKDEINKDGLVDFKWFCFNGEPKFIYISKGLDNHKTAEISFYDLNYDELPFCREDYDRISIKPKKPKNFELMKEIASRLSKNIPFVRIDLYEIEGKVYFSEITFSPCSGFLPFSPQKYDLIIGDLIDLP